MTRPLAGESQEPLLPEENTMRVGFSQPIAAARKRVRRDKHWLSRFQNLGDIPDTGGEARASSGECRGASVLSSNLV